MTEAVDTLVKSLTSKAFEDRILVILAGYEMDIDDMLKTNPGLKSRFAERLQFRNLTGTGVERLFELKMKKQKLSLKKVPPGVIAGLAARLAASNEFANGRDVESWSRNTYAAVASRSRSRGPIECTTGDLERGLNKLLEGRLSASPATVAASCARQTGDVKNQQSAIDVVHRTSAPAATNAYVKVAKASNVEAQPAETASEVQDDAIVIVVNPFAGIEALCLETHQQVIPKGP